MGGQQVSVDCWNDSEKRFMHPIRIYPGRRPITMRWFHHGKLHREDGPAAKYPNGYSKYYLFGTPVSFELFLKLTRGPVEELPLYLGMGAGTDKYIEARMLIVQIPEI